MTDFDVIPENVDGGPVRHIPVLLQEVLHFLEPSAGKIIFDGTFGAGGYSRAVMDAGANIIATDQDPDVIDAAAPMLKEYGKRLSLHHGKFSDILDFIDESSLDGMVLDIGVSSMQIDEAIRGFSFRFDGPLDMRMAQSGVSAADVVNTLAAGDLARIFGFYGEERQAGRIGRAIEAAREIEPIMTTAQLARIVEKTIPRKAKDRIHPATKVFQALRIFVNDELGELARALFAAEKALKPGGRLVVVTFHSLEDRIVKKFFTDRFGRVSGSRHRPEITVPDASFVPIGKKAMLAASEEEIAINPRSRSAKIRAGMRTDKLARSEDFGLFSLPKLVPLSLIGRKA